MIRDDLSQVVARYEAATISLATGYEVVTCVIIYNLAVTRRYRLAVINNAHR